jgi:hypothetical protein
VTIAAAGFYSTIMRHRTSFALLLIAPLLSGCSMLAGSGTGGEYAKLDQTVQFLTVTVSTINDLAEVGIVLPDQLRKLLPYAQAAREALARAEAAYEAGSRDTLNSDYRAAMAAAAGAIDVLVKAKADAQKTKAAVDRVQHPPTGPPLISLPPPTPTTQPDDVPRPTG